MISSRPNFSLGALAVVLCLALPMGVLSLFAPSTTSDELESADAVLVARVTAVQFQDNASARQPSFLELEIEERLLGGTNEERLRFTLDGRPSLRTGDVVLALVGFAPNEILGSYQLRKGVEGYVVSEPITGFYSEGVADVPNQPLEFIVDAFKSRLGLLDPNELPGAGSEKEALGEGVDPNADFLEPNDDIGAASPVFLNPPVSLTGTNPVQITGLTLTNGDIDFFGFEAPGLTILHAETKLPRDITGMGPDTIIGLFDATSGELLAQDDDSGPGKLSRLVVPIEAFGVNDYAVAVEGAPGSVLGEGGMGELSTGQYEVQFELEKGSYITNTSDLIVGVSSDGTFIEDFIGYKTVNGADVLFVGVPADGWALSYEFPLAASMSNGLPSDLTGVFGGAGDFLVEPAFNELARPVSFDIRAFSDEFGFNRAGVARSQNFVGATSIMPGVGMGVDLDYVASVNQETIKGEIKLKTMSSGRVRNAVFERLLDVDLFDEGGDTLTWSFPANGKVRAFAVPATDTVGGLTEPGSNSGSMTGDLQAALTARSEEDTSLGKNTTLRFPIAVTLVRDYGSAGNALDAAGQNLLSCGVDAWVIAVDDDPETGLFTAFGLGITDSDR